MAKSPSPSPPPARSRTKRPLETRAPAPEPQGLPLSSLPGTPLLHALMRMLQPLVRLCVRGGVTFPVLSDLLRTLFVEVAQAELPDPRARTDSRISLMTGVHRKEIRRLRGLSPEEHAVPEAVSLTSEVVARWLGTPGLMGADGGPVPLPRVAPVGEPSFEALVTAVTTDLRPRAILEEWLSQGIAKVDPDGRVRLLTGAFIPGPGRAEQLFFFGRNLHDHLAAAASNLLAPGTAPFPDASVHYDRLSPHSAARLEAAGREAAQRLLLDVNRIALGLVDSAAATPEPAAGTRRVNVGVYLYVEDEPAGHT